MGEIGSIEYEVAENGDYVPMVKDDWYTEEEYNAYLGRQLKLRNTAAHDAGTPFFTAMAAELREFNEKKYDDGKSLNELIRDLP
jgi:hypothetical protein